MKKNELRIGNLVSINNDIWGEFKRVPMIVTKIDSDTDDMFPVSTGAVSVKSLDKMYPNDFAQFDEFIEPIKLTEEWLLNFGFYKHNNAWKIGKQNLYPNFNFSIWKDMSVNSAEFPVKLQYVHQLQNLYFALKGEELTIK